MIKGIVSTQNKFSQQRIVQKALEGDCQIKKKTLPALF
jgi:hypothetical protein